MAASHLVRGLALRTLSLARPSEHAQFWLAQVFLVLATVLGVFLAAQAGFRTALQYEQLAAQRTVYHLLSALEAEVGDNAERMADAAATLQRQGDLRQIPEIYGPRRFVWHTMIQTPDTFRVPADIVTGVRRYYDEVEKLLLDLERQTISRKYFSERVAELNENLRANALAHMAVVRARIADDFASAGYEL